MRRERQTLAATTEQGDPIALTSRRLSEPVAKNRVPNADQIATGANNEEAQSKPFDISMLRWTRVVGVFTAVLAFVGALQAWSFIHGERAALYFDIEQINPLPIPTDKTFSIDISISNIGRSQGFITEGKINVWVGKDLPDRPPFDNVSFNIRGFAPPQTKRFMRFGPLNKALNWAEVQDVERGVQRLFIFGYANYTDDFSILGSRKVGFCGVYRPDGQSISGHPAIDECGSPNYVYNY